MRIIATTLFAFIISSGYTQTVNAYAQVTGIVGSTATLGTVDEAAHTFEDGEWVVIMQMQDDVIGTITNTVAFGDLGDISNTGIYEVRQISSHTEVAGSPTTITFVSTPNYTYNFNTNSSVQIISLRTFGSPDYTTTGNMSAKNWDGQTGGVLAVHVPGTLTLLHNLSADLAGFRGAGPNAGGSAGCSGAANYRVTTQANFADKGEGIYKNTTGTYNAGMGRILNGGGGGNSHNGGGGGGGNYTSGGDAGPGWPTCNPSAGGLGGLALQGQINVGRIFMGGGGGAGEGNNNLSTDGGNGGGIILLKADQVITNACSGVTISANGESISFAGNDGGGGGGAGGSIVFEVNSWTISGGCPLTVEASGGDGGTVNNGATHGGGGGGGQGVVFYSTAEPTANTTTITNNGQGGCDNSSNPCTSQAGSGGGVDGDGVIELTTGPLPITLLTFDAEINNDKVDLYWSTKSEINNDYFTIEHSVNLTDWRKIATSDGAGTSNNTLHYFETHDNPALGINYYRLRQTDFNGTYSFAAVQSVYYSEDRAIVYPNPANDLVKIQKPRIEQCKVQLYNLRGQIIPTTQTTFTDMVELNVKNIESGVYFIRVSNGEFEEFVRFTITH